MGGYPCRAKDLLDQGAAVQRSFECMRNTVLITLPLGYGPSAKLAEAAKAAAESWAAACAAIASELNGHLPPDAP